MTWESVEGKLVGLILVCVALTATETETETEKTGVCVKTQTAWFQSWCHHRLSHASPLMSFSHFYFTDFAVSWFYKLETCKIEKKNQQLFNFCPCGIFYLFIFFCLCDSHWGSIQNVNPLLSSAMVLEHTALQINLLLIHRKKPSLFFYFFIFLAANFYQ